jgi:CDP-diacylglycerol--serine O-phosphatidyltransferase
MKIYKHLPNLLTLLNAAFGFLAIVELFGEQSLIKLSLLFGLGLLMDVADGAVARLLKVSSELGTQLDSLADVISFGLFPASLLYHLFIEDWPIAALILSCATISSAVLRLAKFNLKTDHIPGFFTGMPTPAFAALAFILFVIQQSGSDDFSSHYFPIIVGFYLVFLLNSKVKFLNFKPKQFNSKTLSTRIIFVLSFVVILLYPSFISLVIILLLYHILSAIAYRIEL